MQAWYLIQTKPRQEYIARTNLERQGYPTYLPLAPIKKRRRGRTFTESGPMFPRYLFISLSDTEDNWSPIRSTIGVTALVKFGQQPARVPEGLIAALREREDAHGLQPLPEKTLTYGDRLRISEGPFEGYEGLFYARSSRDRVVLLIKVVEQYARVEVPKDKIESVE